MDDDNIIFLTQEKNIRADAQRNRQKLLDAARNLFDCQGIEQVTMSAIAKKAQVGKGTLYRHFADKAVLCHALLDTAMRDLQQRTLDCIRQTDDPAEALRWFLHEGVQYTVQNADLLMEAANQGNENMLHHPAHIWCRQTIRGLLAQMQVAGDADYIADTLYIMLDVQTIRYQRTTQGYSPTRIVQGLHMTLARLTDGV